jgi:hypothetical protein
MPVEADELGARVQVREQFGDPDVVQGFVTPSPLSVARDVTAVDIVDDVRDRCARGF